MADGQLCHQPNLILLILLCQGRVVFAPQISTLLLTREAHINSSGTLNFFLFVFDKRGHCTKQKYIKNVHFAWAEDWIGKRCRKWDKTVYCKYLCEGRIQMREMRTKPLGFSFNIFSPTVWSLWPSNLGRLLCTCGQLWCIFEKGEWTTLMYPHRCSCRKSRVNQIYSCLLE